MMQQRVHYLFAVFILFFPLACSDKIEPGTTTESPAVVKDVPLATASMADQPIIYEAVGTVRAGIKSNLSSKLLGTVEAIHVREGDRVKQGDTLVLIDQRQVNAGLSKAEAGLSEAKKGLAAAISNRDAAQASEKLALATYERYVNLKKDDSVSVQEFDEVEARYRQAKAALRRADAMVEAATARVKQAEAAVVTAQVSRKDAVITAPHDGIITGKMIDKGDLAKPGTPLLALETTQGFCVDVVLPETYIDHVQPRQKVSVRVPALKTGPLEGNVCTIVPSADPRSRSFIVKINLPIERKVRSGLFARVEIPIGHTKKLLIAQKTVVVRGQLTGLHLVDSNNTAHFRLIRLGKTFGDSVEVLSGLKEGDRYVVEPTPRLQDGVKVEVSP
ncbi:MAG: efflux RND transporter periplasmic adaptor subunit [Deltaproteobacteria bacterium]|nr:MAG: efflux RND transporter periplasmic adaptor subunit [Deltaproteobacteria bacterium]